MARLPDITTEKPKLKFSYNQLVKFVGEVKPYRVKACDERWVICTKPFNLQRTVLYTIIDLRRNIRGTENLIFCAGFETDRLCREALGRFQREESEISARNFVKLEIEWVKG